MKYALILFLFMANAAMAAAPSLEQEIKDLDTNESVPEGKVSERLYSVQTRAVPLAGHFEGLITGGWFFSGNDFLSTQQLGVEGQYHFSDKWSAALAYSSVANQLNSSAHNLQGATGYLPDVDYARNRLEARVQYNLLYGKIRFSTAQALTFDQYIGLGLAQNNLASGTSVGPVLDLGLAFWFDGHYTVHVGAKDYSYNEDRLMSKGWTDNAQGYLDIGSLF